MILYKKYRKKPLTDEQKEHNRKLASFRMRVENKICEIKIFKIISNVYRNFQKKYHMRFNIIAGIVNLKHGPFWFGIAYQILSVASLKLFRRGSYVKMAFFAYA